MSNIKIALTNLGKYNEGELVYKWVELPADEADIQDAFNVIGVHDGTEYEEYFVSDYEAPLGIKIQEYSNVWELNELAEALENIEIPEERHGRYEPSDVINFAMELCNENIVPNADEYVQDIISDDLINEMVRHHAEQGEWELVKFFLADADINEEYHWLNGYGNVERLTNDRLESVMHDLMQEIRNNI
ncbi:antirestriction protein ArdA [Bacillus sp. 7894-2]|uniref:antirestriction protein ArdA n=1 Tax=Bacillus sp. 7894-2 TaxID=2021695 RepID=UPI0015C73E31|nr:antirestriction protein ArdA [Bacillus sp. 7894-2]